MSVSGCHIIVAGIGMQGSGYPNARNTIEVLARVPGLKITDVAVWLPEELHLWQLARGSLLQKLIGAARLGVATLQALARFAKTCRPGWKVYVPYPSLPFLWVLSWLPTRWRPHCICDAYITVWDALYQDRRMGNVTSLAARLLLRFESRALRAAEVVLVDTSANVEHVSQSFCIPIDRIRAVPLALIPCDWSTFPSRTRNNNVIRVLFIGTFVPLQGAELIAEAIDSLRSQDKLQFTLIGDGQQAGNAAVWLDGHPGVTWMREWQTPQVIAEHVAGADICLGVFGGNGKAERVLPFKLYMALAAGKAIITQSVYSTPGTPAIPALTVPPTAIALRTAILDLANCPEQRFALQRDAVVYYHQYLDDAAVVRAWSELLKLDSEPTQATD